MANSVTLNGHTYTDDSNPVTGLDNNGHRVRLIPMFGDAIIELDGVKGETEDVRDQAEAAQDSAAQSASIALAAANTAVNAPGTNATSNTPLDIVASGTIWLDVQPGKLFSSQFVLVTHAPGQWMHGQVASYDAANGRMSVAVDTKDGAGNFNAWTITIAAPLTQEVTSLKPGTLQDDEVLIFSGGVLKGVARRYKWKLITADYQAVHGDRLSVDTRAGIVKVTLPPNPQEGDWVALRDGAGNFATNYLLIDPGARAIEYTPAGETMKVRNSSDKPHVVFSCNAWRV